MNAMDEKKGLRSALLAQRLAIPTEEKQSLDRALVELAVTLPAFREAHLVLLYAPTKGEPDLLPLARRALDQGKKVAFPRCQPADRSLIFYTVSTTEELSQGCYGIPEPPIREPRPVFSKQYIRQSVFPSASGKSSDNSGTGYSAWVIIHTPLRLYLSGSDFRLHPANMTQTRAANNI